jgi:hypothetical protein
MKNSIGTIGNRTRDLPACSAVPQPTAPHRVTTPPPPTHTYIYIYITTFGTSLGFNRLKLSLHTEFRKLFHPKFFAETDFHSQMNLT